ncbi:hypothetical protein A3A38_02125 [Candidatus Kaiserbacteria bacterium RIFCSPLOWO2_01_FULL_53_17]|uniref:Nucleotidase n=1 Tax=Candidatus Kaiserbacteria bacterium RIFCSPLOWO2_01_FULL_53_17 TaxID=1798511 RepID=A0A1F6EFP3_9BACT|nr:MAG: hypothetical protein A3A38_02125 [Candidatus Kaiserbacteria bacterium RIFCSPLOWO2_01_FULL_53_17]
MKIGIDLDDTVISHTKNFVLLAHERGHRDATEDTVHAAAFKARFSADEYRSVKETLYGPMSVGAEPMRESVDTLHALARGGADIFIISRRVPSSREFALRWIAKHLSGTVSFEKIFFTENDEEKGAVCALLGLRLFLDDKREVLRHIAKETTLPVLFDRFDAEKDAPFARVRNWRDFYELYTQKAKIV